MVRGNNTKCNMMEAVSDYYPLTLLDPNKQPRKQLYT